MTMYLFGEGVLIWLLLITQGESALKNTDNQLGSPDFPKRQTWFDFTDMFLYYAAFC